MFECQEKFLNSFKKQEENDGSGKMAVGKGASEQTQDKTNKALSAPPQVQGPLIQGWLLLVCKCLQVEGSEPAGARSGPYWSCLVLSRLPPS